MTDGPRKRIWSRPTCRARDHGCHLGAMGSPLDHVRYVARVALTASRLSGYSRQVPTTVRFCAPSVYATGFIYHVFVPHIMLRRTRRCPRLDACKTRGGARTRHPRFSRPQRCFYDQPEEDKRPHPRLRPLHCRSNPSPIPRSQCRSCLRRRHRDSTDQQRRGRVDDPAGDYLTMMIDLVQKTGNHVSPMGARSGCRVSTPSKAPDEYLHAEATSDLEGRPASESPSPSAPSMVPVTQSQVIRSLPRGVELPVDHFLLVFACDPDATTAHRRGGLKGSSSTSRRGPGHPGGRSPQDQKDFHALYGLRRLST